MEISCSPTPLCPHCTRIRNFVEFGPGKSNEPQLMDYMKIADSRIECLQLLVRRCKKDKDELEETVRRLEKRLASGDGGDDGGGERGQGITSAPNHDLTLALKTAQLQLNILQRRNIDLEQQLKNTILHEHQHSLHGRKSRKEFENALLEGLLRSDGCLYPSLEQMNLEDKNKFLESQLSHCCQEKAKLKYLLQKCEEGRRHAKIDQRPAHRTNTPEKIKSTTRSSPPYSQVESTKFQRVSSRSGAAGATRDLKPASTTSFKTRNEYDSDIRIDSHMLVNDPGKEFTRENKNISRLQPSITTTKTRRERGTIIRADSQTSANFDQEEFNRENEHASAISDEESRSVQRDEQNEEFTSEITSEDSVRRNVPHSTPNSLPETAEEQAVSNKIDGNSQEREVSQTAGKLHPGLGSRIKVIYKTIPGVKSPKVKMDSHLQRELDKRAMATSRGKSSTLSVPTATKSRVPPIISTGPIRSAPSESEAVPASMTSIQQKDSGQKSESGVRMRAQSQRQSILFGKVNLPKLRKPDADQKRQDIDAKASTYGDQGNKVSAEGYPTGGQRQRVAMDGNTSGGLGHEITSQGKPKGGQGQRISMEENLSVGQGQRIPMEGNLSGGQGQRISKEGNLSGGVRQMFFKDGSNPEVRTPTLMENDFQEGNKRSVPLGRSVSPNSTTEREESSPAAGTGSFEIITIKSPPKGSHIMAGNERGGSSVQTPESRQNRQQSSRLAPQLLQPHQVGPQDHSTESYSEHRNSQALEMGGRQYVPEDEYVRVPRSDLIDMIEAGKIGDRAHFQGQVEGPSGMNTVVKEGGLSDVSVKRRTSATKETGDLIQQNEALKRDLDRALNEIKRNETSAFVAGQVDEPLETESSLNTGQRSNERYIFSTGARGAGYLGTIQEKPFKGSSPQPPIIQNQPDATFGPSPSPFGGKALDDNLTERLGTSRGTGYGGRREIQMGQVGMAQGPSGTRARDDNLTERISTSSRGGNDVGRPPMSHVGPSGVKPPMKSTLESLSDGGLGRETTLEREILSLRASLTVLGREKDDKSRELAQKEITLAQLRFENEKQLRNLSDLELRLKNSEQAMSHKEDLQRNYERDIALLRRQLENARKDFEELRRERDEVLNRFRDLSGVSSVTELDRQTLKAELEKKKEEEEDLRAGIQRYIEEVRRIEELLEWKEEENQALLNQFRSLKDDFSQLENAQISLERESDMARTNFRVRAEENGVLRHQLTGQASLLKSYEQQIERLTQQVSALESQLRSVSEAGHTFESDSKTLHTSYMTLERNVDTLRLELSNCQSNRKLLEGEIADLRLRNAELEKVLGLEGENMSRLQEIIETYRETKDLQQEKIQKMEEEKDLLEAQVRKLVDSNEKLHGEIGHWRLKMVEATAELDGTRRLFENEKVEREAVLEELKALRHHLTTSSASLLINSALYSRGSVSPVTSLSTGRSLALELNQGEENAAQNDASSAPPPKPPSTQERET